MKRNWLRILPPLLVLFAALMVSHLAFAEERDDDGFAAPEIDLRLAIEGLAVAGGAAVLLGESIRRRQ
jgi:hypothetical protein